VFANAVYFAPILLIAKLYYPGAITNAGVVTLFIFGGLTATVFITKKDFSFIRGALVIGSFGLLGMIVGSWIFGFQLGMFFSLFGVLLFAGYILYFTSQTMNVYRPSQYVAASLALFSAVAMLFIYVLRFVMELSRD
jgi:FtsH-binding integral membrane protein